jgi:PAS domain S-box-containing protein
MIHQQGRIGYSLVPGFFWMVFLLIFLVLLPAFPIECLGATPIYSAAEVDYPPFSLVDKNGRADGFSIELLREALKAMNRKVSFRSGTWVEVRDWLEQGKIQALPLVGRTPERESLFDFTFAYMTLHGAIVVRKDNKEIQDMSDLAGRKVAVMKGDNAEEFLRRKDRGINIHTTDTFEEALQQLSKGLCDAVVIQRLVALRLIQETGLRNLRVIDRPIEDFRQDFCFAVKEGDRDTLALLNEGLSMVMADGTYRHLHSKWFAALQLPANRPIVVGGDHDYPPFEYLDDDGRAAGYNVELTKAIAREMGLDIEIRLGPWAEIVDEMEEGDIDVIQGMFYLPERDLKFDFTQPHMVNHYVSIVRKGEGDPPTELKDLAGKNIVVEKRDAAHDFLVEKGFGGQISVVETQEDVLRELTEGKHDCGFAVRITSLYLIEEKGWRNLVLGKQAFLPLEYCYAAPNNHKAILAQLSEGLKILEKSGEYRRLHDKWLGGYEQSPPSLVNALRYSAMVVIPLAVILLAILLWSWFLRRKVNAKTRELQKSLEFQRAMIGCSPVALYSIDLDGKVLAWNKSAEKIFGWTAEEIIDKPLPIVPEDKKDEFSDFRKKVLQDGAFSGVEVTRLRKDGNLFDGSLSVAPIYNPRGEIIGIMSAMEDITQRKQAETALRKSEIRYRSLFDYSMDAFLLTAPDGSILEVNPAACAMFGRTADEIKKLGREALVDASDPRLQKALEERAKKGSVFGEITMIRADNTRFPAEISSVIYMDENGEQRSSIIIRGITERKRAEEDREKLQAQLIQAQKIESVGRLAGGVAHDYNNMLTVILGNTQLMLSEMDKDGAYYGMLLEIREATERSIEITRQLLAFARKQTIMPKVLDLNGIVEGMLKVLRRLIGEDIDLIWQPDTNLWRVKMDPVQIDQILANLCVNSRDAIADVGKVTIETENVVLDENYSADREGFLPGDYVMLAVSDNGSGMDKETLENVFVPFFTTKEIGVGTGLGLSTVYGIVKQNHGFINIYSEPGKGTTVKIYLPRYGHEAEAMVEAQDTVIMRGGGETVLVVEDEATVLRLTQKMLERMGYVALTAGMPGEAVKTAEGHDGAIDLLITDVVLPEMSGKDLAAEIMKIRPDIRVLFMSGYTADVIAHQGVLDEGAAFIEKPFTFQRLTTKVIETLGKG